jgi:hypothetical protein
MSGVGHKRSLERGGAFYSTFLLMVAGGILGAGLIAFMRVSNTNPLKPSFLEKAPPSVTITEMPLGIGADEVPLKVEIKDPDAGLDEVIVRIAQRNQPKELLRKRYDDLPNKGEVFTIPLNGKQLGLREGNAELQILAFDRSLWSNTTIIAKTLPVNFAKPVISVVTPQQNGVLGGSELVFYKVLGKRPKTQGVISKQGFYPGFPAKEWDDTFKSYDALYISLFPIPATFKSNSDSMHIIARDDIGNSTSSPFNYRIRQRRWSSFRVMLNDQTGARLKERLATYAQETKTPVNLSGDLAADLRSLLRTISTSDEALLVNSLVAAENKKLWAGAFLKPVAANPSNSVGDTRTVLLNTTEIMKGPAAGVRFAASSRAAVVSANSGKVAFVGELGTLGKTIVLDHGFGLATVYGNLSEVSVQENALVAKNQPIGRAGASGFALSEGVYFEVRLHGIPVTPNEWWDEAWVNDHIENKVAFVRTEVVGGAGE